MKPLRSFTLFELLIAIALLLALVMTLLPATHRIMSRTTERHEESARLAQLAVMTDVIDRAMLTALAVNDRGRIGIAARPSSIRLTSCGVDMTGESTIPDIQSIEIVHRRDEVAIRRGTGALSTLVPGVERIEIRVHDGESWQEPADEPGSVPRAIALSLWFASGDATDEEEDIFSSESADLPSPDWRRVFTPFMLRADAEDAS